MCQFSIPYSGDSESLLQRARHEIERAGGALNGNAMQGNFQAKTPIGSIQGTYQFAGEEIVLSILKKPLLLSCKRIEKELRGVMR
jgi:hypothetical protein